jgi:hypothetical protein
MLRNLEMLNIDARSKVRMKMTMNRFCQIALLDQLGVDYECIDCLDEDRNPGLRDGIKAYSDWCKCMPLGLCCTMLTFVMYSLVVGAATCYKRFLFT